MMMWVAITIQFVNASCLLGKQNSGGLYHDLFSVSFPTENEGWACGRRGTVLHTADGGVSWIRQESGTEFTLSSVHFADAKNGMAVGHEGTIIHTADGGMTWELQKSPVDSFLMDVHCITPLKALIVTERTHILLTENSGKTWSMVFKDNDFILKALSFCDALHGWAVGEYGFIYHTEDGGVSWQKQAGDCWFSPTTGALVGEKYLFDVAAISQQAAWAVGIDGCVKRTIDGGRTLTEVVSGAPQTQLYCVCADGKGTVTITITPYSAQGTPLSPIIHGLAGKGKYVDVASQLGLPSETAWFRIDSTSLLNGFELFGTADGNQIGAYSGGGGAGAKVGVFPKIEKNGWTGIAFVNTESIAGTVTLTANDDNGTVVATQTLAIGSYVKVVNVVEAIFSQNTSNTAYITYSSDRNAEKQCMVY